jgi:hypothetical protein
MPMLMVKSGVVCALVQANFNSLRRQLATLHARFYAILFFVLFLIYFMVNYIEVSHKGGMAPHRLGGHQTHRGGPHAQSAILAIITSSQPIIDDGE